MECISVTGWEVHLHLPDTLLLKKKNKVGYFTTFLTLSLVLYGNNLMGWQWKDTRFPLSTFDCPWYVWVYKKEYIPPSFLWLPKAGIWTEASYHDQECVLWYCFFCIETTIVFFFLLIRQIMMMWQTLATHPVWFDKRIKKRRQVGWCDCALFSGLTGREWRGMERWWREQDPSFDYCSRHGMYL